ncbi:MAG: hypothetical protein JO267_10270 [Alphaproteobacteria bacterium]|nr:hypothetical protein [Alphaproteobacteria bacterium]
MIALPKLLLLFLVIAAAWYAFRWVNGQSRNPPHRRPAASGRARPAPPALEAEDLVACGACGAYVAISARRCGRADCPRPR